MSTLYEIPLSPAPQTFGITLGGQALIMTLQWREAGAACWLLDIADAAGNPMVAGIPLVTGHDLLEQYAYLGLGGALLVATDGDPDAMPTFDNLGVASHLYWRAD